MPGVTEEVADEGRQTQTDFDLLEEEIAPFHIGNRTRSTALLAWFLETVWRLEPEDASDSICDGGGDKGIDAIHVDEDAQEITVFQAKRRSGEHQTQGDNDLKNFIGTATYFEGPEGIDALLQSGPNEELRNLVDRLSLRSRLENADHGVRLVFVTNANLDAAGIDYITARGEQSPVLDVWARDRSAGIAERTAALRVGDSPISLEAAAEPMVVDLPDGVRMAVGLFAAPDLVRLPGIDDLSIFQLNVRLGLGRTRINKELARTIKDPQEHDLFCAYHNGMTLLTRAFEVDGTDLDLTGVSVVNGCQSLLALHANQSSLSPSLKVLVRIVELGTHTELVDSITYRTNNQNPVNIRDQRSTDRVQRDLQTELAEKYGTELGLAIRNGEPLDGFGSVVENSFIAQLMMATYLEEPWNAVRKLKLFDQEYHRIFNRHLNADKVFLLHLIDEAMRGQRSGLAPELVASFSSVRFTIASLVFELVRLTADGEAFLEDPSTGLHVDRGRVVAQLEEATAEAIQSINDFVIAREEEAAEAGSTFDPKTIFKSRTGVALLRRDAVGYAKRMMRRDESYGFHLDGDS